MCLFTYICRHISSHRYCITRLVLRAENIEFYCLVIFQITFLTIYNYFVTNRAITQQIYGSGL